MARVIFDGFENQNQAKEFAEWYSGCGEQDSGIWMEANTDLAFVGAQSIIITDSPTDDVIVNVKLYKKK